MKIFIIEDEGKYLVGFKKILSDHEIKNAGLRGVGVRDHHGDAGFLIQDVVKQLVSFDPDVLLLDNNLDVYPLNPSDFHGEAIFNELKRIGKNYPTLGISTGSQSYLSNYWGDKMEVGDYQHLSGQKLQTIGKDLEASIQLAVSGRTGFACNGRQAANYQEWEQLRLAQEKKQFSANFWAKYNKAKK